MADSIPPIGSPAQYRTEQLLGQVYTNVAQDIIQIGSAIARNILVEWYGKVQMQDSWTTPLGILVTIVLTVLGTEFKDNLGLSKEFWKGITATMGALVFIWLVVNLKRRVFQPAETPDQILEKFKNLPLDALAAAKKR